MKAKCANHSRRNAYDKGLCVECLTAAAAPMTPRIATSGSIHERIAQVQKKVMK